MGNDGHGSSQIKALFSALAAAFVGLAVPSGAVLAQDVPSNLTNLSIEDLATIDITSVTKVTQPLNRAPAAVYVITHEDIVRSGLTSIPEILRLAPNLQVAQASASGYAISARGFNGAFADKLLVLIDGRSVYSPLYGGVFWDAQSVLVEDIERIEVISGPGATLWGANAVNGVINIITLKSADTQGGSLDVGGGNLQRGASLQYGGRLSDQLTYRIYAKDVDYSDTKTATGANAHDGWSMPQGGFRLDWSPPDDTVTVQGDLSRALERQQGAGDLLVASDDLLARWHHASADGSALQVQVYYDQTRRYTANGGGGLTLNTYDLDIQHSFALGRWNAIVWGGGERVEQDHIVGTSSIVFNPTSRTLNLANVFVQDSMSLSDAVTLTVGLKLEDEPYSDLAPLPSARISWQVTDTAMLWSAVSRAVRAPTRFDVDFIEKSNGAPFLTGSPNFQPEELIAYEVGARFQPSSRASFSISTFYNDYNDLRSIEAGPAPFFLPLHWGNLMEGDTYGVEAWGNYRMTDWWQLAAGFNVQHESLRFKSGSSQLGGIQLAGDDPRHQASLRSTVSLADDVTWEADLRYVGKLPSPAVPSYAELNSRLAWKVSPSLDISLSGFNLLHARHSEFIAPPLIDEVERSFYLETRWRF